MVQVKTFREDTLGDIDDKINNFIKDKEIIDIKPIPDDDWFFAMVIYK